jgi:hypothetical protein
MEMRLRIDEQSEWAQSGGKNRGIGWERVQATTPAAILSTITAHGLKTA